MNIMKEIKKASFKIDYDVTVVLKEGVEEVSDERHTRKNIMEVSKPK